MKLFKPNLLEKLTAIRGASGDEELVKNFVLDYVKNNQSGWKVQPEIFEGNGFQDTLVLVFGKPKTAIFAHLDSIGFTVGYENNLIKIGGPKLIDGTKLVGSDTKGEIETELMIIEGADGAQQIKCVFEREIDRGTILTFQPDFRCNKQFVQSPYLDNRLGVLNALIVAEEMEHGAIVFSTYEEHGGNSVGFLARFLYENFGVRQALISDITWVTEGVQHNGGVAISMRDRLIPRRKFLNSIIKIAADNQIQYQLEVEAFGGSDGSMLQQSDLPFDWCFIGAPEDNVHSPNEKVFINDIESMIGFYKILMKELN